MTQKLTNGKLAEGVKGGAPPWKEGEAIDLRIAHWNLWGPLLKPETTSEAKPFRYV